MMQMVSRPRGVLLAITLLSACAARNAVDPPDPSNLYGDFLIGTYAADHDDFETAATALLAAHEKDPSSQDILERAFLASLLDGQPEALRLAPQLPQNATAQLLLANEAARAGDWDRAAARFDALPHEGVTQLVQPLLVAWAEQGAGRTDAAEATLRPYLERSQLRAVYLLHAALIADVAGRGAEAERFYQAAAQQYGGLNLRLGQLLASWKARQGQMAEATNILEALGRTGDPIGIVVPTLMKHITAQPIATPTDGMAEAYLALGASLVQQNEREYSMVLARLALDLRPDFTAARLLMADNFAAAKHFHAALHALARVPESDPYYPLVQLRRASFENQAGESEEAIALLRELIAEYPSRPEAAAELGDILREKNRYAEAIAAYNTAISRIGEPQPGNWVLFFARGIAYDRSHEWEKAEADLKEALRLAPNQPYVLNYLAYSWAEQRRNLTEARQMLEAALRQRSDDGAIIDSLGWVLFRQGDIRGAVRMLERAAELEPEDATINAHLGDAYWADGAKLQAAYQWQLALTLKPDPEDIPALKAKLREAQLALSGQTAANEQAR